MEEESIDQKKTIARLERALYHEAQYRTSLLSTATSFYDANITKDLIESDFFFKNRKTGELISVPEYVGLSIPCKFSEFVKRWVEKVTFNTTKSELGDIDHINSTLIESYNSGKRDYVMNYWMESSDNSRLYINQRFLLTKNEDGDICTLAIVKDYTDKVSNDFAVKQEMLEQYAYFDQITKGYNYIKFKEKLRKVATDGSIICLDIHNFKIVNSICGISRGDQVIKEIWNKIFQMIDVSAGNLAAHVNADHFIIFLNTKDNQTIVRTLKNISLSLSLISAEMSVPQIRPYFGVSSWHTNKKIEQSYNEAIIAKHKAKEQQNSDYAFFNEEDTMRTIRDKKMTDSFEDALARKEFKLWFQPKYNPITKKLVGAEALVRWYTPDGAIIQPGDFIPLFEKSNLIRQLDEYIFRNLCLILSGWQRAGKNIVPISVNLSRASLYYKEIVNLYKNIVEKIGLDKKFVPIEITETAAITNRQIKEIADDFHAAGFTLQMDDFGSGYSSLASLNTMHFETLKLDKSLIDFIGNFGGDRLIEHTICLAKELGMYVTAEGVEKEDQVNFLKHTGCDSIQGFYYSKPIPKNEFEIILDTLEQETIATEMDHLTEHIRNFNQSFIRGPLYSFTVNLTKDNFITTNGLDKWKENTGIDTNNYSEALEIVAENFITEPYKKAFLSFMDRNKLIANFCGIEETRILNYDKQLKGQTDKIRMIYHIFKIEDSDDIWAYINLSIF